MFQGPKVFSAYIAWSEQHLFFDYVSQQKYFFDIQWYKDITMKHLFILSQLL